MVGELQPHLYDANDTRAPKFRVCCVRAEYIQPLVMRSFVLVTLHFECFSKEVVILAKCLVVDTSLTHVMESPRGSHRTFFGGEQPFGTGDGHPLGVQSHGSPAWAPARSTMDTKQAFIPEGGSREEGESCYEIPQAKKEAMLHLVRLVLAVLYIPYLVDAAPALQSDAAPALQPSSAFTVTANGETSFVYLATVPGPTGRGRMNVSFVHLSLPDAGAVNVHVHVRTANSSSPVRFAALRPRGSPTVALNGPSNLSFAIDKAGHYIVELNAEFDVESLSTGLMIFASVAEEPPSPTDPTVTYFGAGVHTIPDKVLQLRSDSTMYLAHGAVVLGRVEASNAHNITVRGPGILAAEWLPGEAIPTSASSCGHCGCPGTHAVLITNSTDVTLTGITIMHVTSWMVKLQGVRGAVVRGIKELGWRCNNDGVDIVSSQQVVVEECFIRSADDAIAVKGLDASRDTTDIVVRDSLFFPHGNCMEIGFELFNNHVKNVTFERITCLHQMMNAFSIHNGGHANVSEITYKVK